MMLLRILYNAGVSLESEQAGGARILCDPWFTPGAFLGSWFHSTPTMDALHNWVLEGPWDAVYVTHLHPDHFDIRLVTTLARRNPNTVFVVPSLVNNWLFAAMTRAVGRHRVVAVNPSMPFSLGDISLHVFPLDTCDPTRCLKLIPCHANLDHHGIDSLGVLEGEGVRVVLGNDALSPSTHAYFVDRVKAADVVMAAYGGASPYPQCYTNLDESAKFAARDEVVSRFCGSLANFAASVGACAVIPYAGEYLLGGSRQHLNQYRATVTKEEAIQRIAAQSPSLRGIDLGPGAVLRLRRGQLPAVVEPALTPSVDEKIRHQSRMDNAVFPYQKLGDALQWNSWREDLSVAASRVERQVASIGARKMESSFRLSAGDATLNVQFGSTFSWNLDPESNATLANHTHMAMPPALLKMIIRRATHDYRGFTTAHWNQAEVGSHIDYQRVGEYEMLPHLLFNYLHM